MYALLHPVVFDILIALFLWFFDVIPDWIGKPVFF
jgi:hypothetical protein